MDGLQFFDPQQDFTIAWRRLPHWSQAGTVCFITFRTNDSLPREALLRLAEQRGEILQSFGVEDDGNIEEAIFGKNRVRTTFSAKVAGQLTALDPSIRARLKWQLFTAWDERLARGAGERLLARPEAAAIVEQSLRHFDGTRYALTDYVVMPNHVHVLVALAEADELLAQVASWKRFTAREINAALGRRGALWQVEHFDHLVRSLEQFEYLRRYVEENPRNARLPAGSFRWYSKRLS